MPAPTVDLLTVIVGPNESQTTEADLEAGINAALASGYNQAVAGLNAGTIAPLVMGGTSNAMTGAMPAALADTSIYNSRAVRFIPPGGNTLPPTIEIGGVVFSIRDMHGRELPAGALTNRRYIGIVTSIGPTPAAQIWLIAPIQMADIPGLAETVMRQRGPTAAGGNINLLIEPGMHFLAANGGYTGLPPDFNTTSAAWLEVVNYGGEGGQGSGRFVLQTLTSMATVLPGGPGHVYRPMFQRRHDSLNPDAASNMAAWTPIHAITPLAGKRVVCLGDSITQGGGPWDWPAMLAGLTGATVVNGGFGGCRMAQHSLPLFDPFSMYRISERIRYGDWSVLTAAADALYVGTGDDRRPAAARLAALDWSQVTHIVIGYGTNDFGGDVPLGSDGDMTGATFKGAINLAIQNILTAYPSIQILIQTPLWRSRVYVSGDDSNVTPNGLGLHLRDYAQAIRDRAAAYQLPVCDLHASAGINPVNAATMMPDGLHPWSTAGVERVATIVAGSLLSASGGGGGSDAAQLGAVLTEMAGTPTAGVANVPAETNGAWGWIREATAAEARNGTFRGWQSPYAAALAAVEVDRGAVSGEVTINPTLGPNQKFRVVGPTKFVAPSGPMIPASGLVRVRVDGPHQVEWGRSIRRHVDDGAMAPDRRPWTESLYTMVAGPDVLRIAPFSVEEISGAPIPTLTQFSAFYDPSGARIGDPASLASAIGDPVSTLRPAGGVWTYVDAAGAAQTLASSARDYTATGASNLPTLVELDGLLAIRHLDGGAGLRAQLSGLQQIGAPNPSGDAMPYLTRLTWGANVYLPVGGGLGPIGGVFRAENTNTAQLALMAGASTLYGHARLASGSVRQASSAADVASLVAVHAAELAMPRGRFVPVVWQVRIGSIDLIEDTAPTVGDTQRGEGATLEIWIGDGLEGHVVVDISSWRGANGLGWRINRSVLGALYSGGTLDNASDVYISRHGLSVDPALVYGSATWRQYMQWLAGR